MNCKPYNVFVILLFLFRNALIAQVSFQENFQLSTSILNCEQQTLDSSSYWSWGNKYSLESEYWKIPLHTNFIATNDDACNCNKNEDIIYLPYIHLNGEDSILIKADIFFNEGTYGGTLESAYILYDNGTSSIYLDTLLGKKDWYNVFIPLTNIGTTDSIRLGFKYSDHGAWLFGLAIDNIQITSMYKKDLQLKELNSQDYFTVGDNLAINGKINNNSFDTVKNPYLYIDYSDSIISRKITSSILPLSEISFSISNLMPLTDVTQNKLKVWVKDSLLDDQHSNNDTLMYTINILPYLNTKNVLIESFTSAECIPCVDAKDNFYNQLEELTTNSSIYSIEYHASSSEFIGDQAFIDEVNSRKEFYFSTDMPYYLVNGSNSPKNIDLFSANDVYENQGHYSPIRLVNEYTSTNDTLSIQVNIEPLHTLPAHFLKLHTLILEKNINISSSILSNGHWENTVRKFVTNPLGLNITDTLHKDSLYTIDLTSKIQQENPISYNSGNFSSIYDNIIVVSFIQDVISKEILQVQAERWPVNIKQTSPKNKYIRVFPNPSPNNKIFIETDDTGILRVELFDNIGNKVFEDIILSSNSIDFPIQFKGFYYLYITSARGTYTSKVLFTH